MRKFCRKGDSFDTPLHLQKKSKKLNFTFIIQMKLFCENLYYIEREKNEKKKFKRILYEKYTNESFIYNINVYTIINMF